MKFTMLGAAREVGRSGVLLKTSTASIVLDYGLKIHGVSEFPKLVQHADAAVISHAHLDHSGFLPALYDEGSPPAFGTYPTQALTDLLIKDSMKIMGPDMLPYKASSFKKALHHYAPLGFDAPHHLNGGTSIRLHDAGHIPGASIIEIEAERKKVVYTGDFKMEGTMLHNGAKPISDVDVLFIESTYSNRDHPPREQTERRLVESVRATLEGGGSALLPTFAVGRAQEILMALYQHKPDLPVFIDGMAKEATRIVLEYPRYIRDFQLLRDAAKAATFVETPAQRRQVLHRPGVVISPAGMLEGGHVMRYLQGLNPYSRVLFTGFCVPDTNGWYLQNKGIVFVQGEEKRIAQRVEYFDFSAHAGRTDLLAFIKAANPQKVVCMHGDHCADFAAELRGMGYDALAPEYGQSFEF